MTKFLVTGGEGFIGSHVVEMLLARGHEVTILDNESTGKFENIQHLVPNSKMYRAQIDICNQWDVLDVFKIAQPEIVLHLAAQASITYSEDQPREDMQTNGIGTSNIILASKVIGVRRIVFASTSAVYPLVDTDLVEETCPGPASPYGISKLAAEGYLSLYKYATILRLGNVYGPRQVPVGENQVIARMIRHKRDGDTFSIHGDGEQERDFVYVKDVAEAFLRAASEIGFRVYNIASGSRHSVNTVGAMVASLWKPGSHSVWEHDTLDDPRRSVRLDVSKAGMELNWHARTSLIEGLRETVAWWKGRL